MATRRSVVMRSVGALLLLALALPACGAGGGGIAQSGGGVPTEGGSTRSGSGGAEASTMMDAGREDIPSSGGGSAMPSSGGDDLAAAGASAQAGGTAVGDFDRKIVKTAELGVRAEDVRENAAEAQRIASQFGGSVLSSQIEGDDDSVSADLVLLVPSPEFEAALDELRGLGKKVTTDAVKGEDVTEEFVDLEAQERNLLAAEASLLELYDRAASVNAALAIERELTNIRGQIEQVQGRIQYLEDRTASSRITLSIDPVASPKPKPPAWSPARVVADAWDASLAVLQAMATVVISAVVFGWWLVPVLIAGLFWWRRRGLPGVRP